MGSIKFHQALIGKFLVLVLITCPLTSELFLHEDMITITDQQKHLTPR